MIYIHRNINKYFYRFFFLNANKINLNSAYKQSILPTVIAFGLLILKIPFPPIEGAVKPEFRSEIFIQIFDIYSNMQGLIIAQIETRLEEGLKMQLESQLEELAQLKDKLPYIEKHLTDEIQYLSTYFMQQFPNLTIYLSIQLGNLQEYFGNLAILNNDMVYAQLFFMYSAMQYCEYIKINYQNLERRNMLNWHFYFSAWDSPKMNETHR